MSSLLHTMNIFLVLLPSLAMGVGNLPPEPSLHLTPPIRTSSDLLSRQPRNNSVSEGPQPSDSDHKLEPHQQEARAILWAAPAIPIFSSHRARSSDCNPCDRVPWVPMARALDTQPQYALSIPTIQLTLPVNYGIPVAQMRPHSPQYGPPPQQYGPPPSAPPNQQGQPPQQGPPHSQGEPVHQGAPHQQGSPSQHGPPYQRGPQPQTQQGPPPQFRPPPQHQPPHQVSTVNGPPSTQYGPPASGDSKANTSPQNSYGPLEDDKNGLPPPPLPQRFISPTNMYGSPKPQTQYASPSNSNPSVYVPPPLPKYQLLPAIKFGPPFDQKAHLKSPSVNPAGPSVAKPINNGPHQYRGEFINKPILVGNPIPFPTMSKTQLPPLYNYQTFNDGKQDQLHSYLQPPKPQNVVFTITETDDSCKKCLEQSQASQVTDSEPAQAEHVTENTVKVNEKPQINPLNNQKPSVQIVKSVPLAEYLASVEYPMQIIQAPILDVPDLTKYFDLGYHNFPQVKDQQHGDKIQDQNPSQSYIQPNKQSPVYTNHHLENTNSTIYLHGSTTGLDNVHITEEHIQTTNSIPLNHKPESDVIGKNQETTEGFTTSPFSQAVTSQSTLSTRPSQIYHISKAKPTIYTDPTRLTTVQLSSSQGLSTESGHYVTTKPMEGKIEHHSPNTASPSPFQEPIVSSAQDHRLSVNSEGLSPPRPPDYRFIDPTRVVPGSISDWTLHSYGRGWGSTPPQPFVMPTSSPFKARFPARQTTVPAKKGKLIHQIIVPYTTNKQSRPDAQEPSNNLGWTPIPPTNQGRKVPTNVKVEENFPSTTGLDQGNSYQNNFPTADFSVSSSPPLSASGSDNLPIQQLPPTSNGQSLNLPPHIINQILQLNHQGNPWPTGPDELQQLLVTNLQGLLRGEEDSIDIARLQKNIDNWTAEGYKQNSPSVNFIPATTIPHIFNSKKIPDEYLTSTEPTVPSKVSQGSHSSHRYNDNSDYDGAESQKHQVKVHPQAHAKDHEVDDTTDSIENLLNSWSLLDTKLTTPPTTSTEVSTTTAVTEPTSKVWEKIQVSISPLTNEKVYVVTPVPVTESSQPDSQQTKLLSTRVERSYSVVTSGEVTNSSLSRHDEGNHESVHHNTR